MDKVLQVKPKFTPQNLSLTAPLNSAGLLRAGFSLITQQDSTPEECLFPIITIETSEGVTVSSSRLHWNSTDYLENPLAVSKQTVYNIPKVNCLSKNYFQLYLTVSGVEYFVAHGLYYVYLN